MALPFMAVGELVSGTPVLDLLPITLDVADAVLEISRFSGEVDFLRRFLTEAFLTAVL